MFLTLLTGALLGGYMSNLTERLRISFCRWVGIYRRMDEFRHVVETDFDWALPRAPKGTLWVMPVVEGLSIKSLVLFLKTHRPGWTVDCPAILELFDTEDPPKMHVLYVTQFSSDGTIEGFRTWPGERAAEKVDRFSPLEGFLFACDRWPTTSYLYLRCVAVYQNKPISLVIKLDGKHLSFKYERKNEE